MTTDIKMIRDDFEAGEYNVRHVWTLLRECEESRVRISELTTLLRDLIIYTESRGHVISCSIIADRCRGALKECELNQ
jgi:hypothetical protein